MQPRHFVSRIKYANKLRELIQRTKEANNCLQASGEISAVISRESTPLSYDTENILNYLHLRSHVPNMIENSDRPHHIFTKRINSCVTFLGISFQCSHPDINFVKLTKKCF